MSEEKFSKNVTIQPGGLHGYTVPASVKARHAALEKTVHKDGYETAVRRLNYIRNLNSNHAHVHEVMSEDVEWLERTYGSKAASAAQERRRRGQSGTRSHPKTIYR